MKEKFMLIIGIILLGIISVLFIVLFDITDNENERLRKELDDLTAECNSLKIDYESVLDTYGR